MTKLQDWQAGNVPRTHELRLHPRRELSGMAYVELSQDNGGILLNLSEGGFAIQSALALSSREFPDLRFQLPNMRGWLTGTGRLVWLSESKKEAGIQFLDLHEHARAQVRMWVGQDALSGPEPTASAAGNGSPVGVGAETSRGEPVHTSQTFLGAAPSARADHASAEMRGGSIPTEGDQGFRFHDYSMFAADPNVGLAWNEPVRQKRGWGSYVLFTVLLAALFFVLGAIIGRDNLNGLVSSSIDGWKRIQGEAPPSAKAPAPPAATESSTPSVSDGQSSAAPSTPSGNGNDTASTPAQEAASSATSESPTQPANGENATAASATPEPKNPANTSNVESSPQGSPTGNAEASNSAAASSNNPSNAAAKTSGDSGVSKAHGHRAITSKNATPPRGESSYANTDASASNEYGPSMLVNAPAPGSPPSFVHLPAEPVSASSSVAINARRSIQIPPRAYDGGYARERMVVGKLLAHSDPFYPVEARAQHIEGIVELHALVGRSGQVLSVTPVSGPGVLATAGVTALREWRYEPTFINGDPVETQVDVTIVFRSR